MWCLSFLPSHFCLLWMNINYILPFSWFILIYFFYLFGSDLDFLFQFIIILSHLLKCPLFWSQDIYQGVLETTGYRCGFNVNTVKHYFPSPAVSCVEAPPVIGHVSHITFPEPNKLHVESCDEPSISKATKDVHIVSALTFTHF